MKWVLALFGITVDNSAEGDIGDPKVADTIGQYYDNGDPKSKAAMEAQYKKRTIEYATKRAAKARRADK